MIQKKYQTSRSNVSYSNFEGSHVDNLQSISDEIPQPALVNMLRHYREELQRLELLSITLQDKVNNLDSHLLYSTPTSANKENGLSQAVDYSNFESCNNEFSVLNNRIVIALEKLDNLI